jgi:hypothetical protein
VCSNNLHMPQLILEQAVVDAVAEALDAPILRAAVERALQRLRDDVSARSERRQHLDHELRAARAQEARLVEAIKLGAAPAALLAALRQEHERRAALEEEHQRWVELEHDAALDERQIAAELAASASNFRAALTERTAEARRVIQALVQDRLDFSAFESDGVRGYEFVGTGTYGGLLAGDTCPTSPNPKITQAASAW